MNSRIRIPASPPLPERLIAARKAEAAAADAAWRAAQALPPEEPPPRTLADVQAELREVLYQLEYKVTHDLVTRKQKLTKEIARLTPLQLKATPPPIGLMEYIDNLKVNRRKP